MTSPVRIWRKRLGPKLFPEAQSRRNFSWHTQVCGHLGAARVPSRLPRTDSELHKLQKEARLKGPLHLWTGYCLHPIFGQERVVAGCPFPLPTPTFSAPLMHRWPKGQIGIFKFWWGRLVQARWQGYSHWALNGGQPREDWFTPRAS